MNAGETVSIFTLVGKENKWQIGVVETVREYIVAERPITVYSVRHEHGIQEFAEGSLNLRTAEEHARLNLMT